MTPLHGGPGRPTPPSPPAGRPIPQLAQVGPEGLVCSLRRVGRNWKPSRTWPPRGVPIPQTAQAGPEGLRCIRRCAGGMGRSIIPKLPSLFGGRHKSQAGDRVSSKAPFRALYGMIHQYHKKSKKNLEAQSDGTTEGHGNYVR